MAAMLQKNHNRLATEPRAIPAMSSNKSIKTKGITMPSLKCKTVHTWLTNSDIFINLNSMDTRKVRDDERSQSRVSAVNRL